MLKSEHLSALKAEIMVALSQEIACAVRKAMSPWMDRASAAAYLQVSVETIDLYKRQGVLKPKRIGANKGSKPIYHRDALDKIPRI